MVCGSARGMTSLVAYVLYELNYFIGHDLQEQNFEDLDFLDTLVGYGMLPKRLARRKDLRNLIGKRNREHVRYGFKTPDAVFCLKELVPLLRDPIVVLCVRNPVATGRSIMTRNPKVKGGITQALNKAIAANSAITYLLDDAPCPSLVVNMDEAQRQPSVFLTELMTALGLEGDTEAIVRKISRKSYKSSTPREGVTFHSSRKR